MKKIDDVARQLAVNSLQKDSIFLISTTTIFNFSEAVRPSSFQKNSAVYAAFYS